MFKINKKYKSTWPRVEASFAHSAFKTRTCRNQSNLCQRIAGTVFINFLYCIDKSIIIFRHVSNLDRVWV